MRIQIAVVEAGENYAERVRTVERDLTGSEQEMIAQAQREVADLGYRVLPDEEGGCCEITRYSDGTPPIVGITVHPVDRR